MGTIDSPLRGLLFHCSPATDPIVTSSGKVKPDHVRSVTSLSPQPRTPYQSTDRLSHSPEVPSTRTVSRRQGPTGNVLFVVVKGDGDEVWGNISKLSDHGVSSPGELSGRRAVESAYLTACARFEPQKIVQIPSVLAPRFTVKITVS